MYFVVLHGHATSGRATALLVDQRVADRVHGGHEVAVRSDQVEGGLAPCGS